MCVIAGFEFSDVIHIFLRALLSRPMGASIVAVSSLMMPSAKARYFLVTVLFLICSAKLLCVSSFLATTNNHDVSASIR